MCPLPCRERDLLGGGQARRARAENGNGADFHTCWLF